MLGRTQNLRWSRKGYAHAPLKEKGLVRNGHAAMHHRVVPVPLDERMQTLLAAPLDLATLLVVNYPARETIEHGHALHGLLVLLEIHKAIPENDILLEIKRDVNEIVPTTKANFIQDPAELILRASRGQILHNESRVSLSL